MIEKILQQENLELACEHLQEKHDSCGLDGMLLSELGGYLQNNMDALRESIIGGTYCPGLVQEVELVSPKGKIRTISKLTSVDRLILRAMHQVMYACFSPVFSEFSHAYQEKKGIITAVRQAANYVEAGYAYTVDIDIESYFDNVVHYKMGEQLAKYGLDNVTNGLIQRFLACKVVRDFEVVPKEKGLVQGSPLSPLLSNLYLHEADLFFQNKGWKFCRYADDIKLFAKTFEEGLEKFNCTKQFMEKELLLQLHPQKSGVFPAIERTYLGYCFHLFSNGRIEIKKKNNKNKMNIYNWRASAIQKVGGEYHLVADGILTRKDYNLLFENTEKKMHIPVNSAECLNLYSNITFGSDFFHFAAQNNIQLNLYNKHGEFAGTFIPKHLSASSSLTTQQALTYADKEKRLAIAKQFALAAAHNIRENIKYYIRRSNSELLRCSIEEITAMLQEEKEADSVPQLMLIEGRVRGTYYNCLNDILPNEDFLFVKRTKRPPKDPINSLISFGNTLLYRRVAKEIYKSRLDIRIGFLHAANRRYESLNLDISEIFRPVIVERTIFALINKHMLSEKSHFELLDNGAVFLTNEGKKIFITEFEEKLMCRLKQKGGSTASYGELIKVEIQKLTRYFDKGEPYKAYKYFL
ncbi:type I-B CRISPR-associated endonuclease Cas1b [Ruminococcaceae bacterium OttesenSCG-928-A16]|nr:type I-B CRISPR-associated endonuclease Cas1b [Ruminococcaceae bacterium OttesenSCG-928-A16]